RPSAPSASGASPAATGAPGATPAAPGRPAASGGTPAPAAPVPRVADDRERRVEIVTDDATLAFTNRGARLVSWRLERYRGAQGYVVQVAVSVRHEGRELPKKVTWGPGVGNPTTAETEVQGYQAPQSVALTENGVERHPAKPGPVVTLSPVRWAGVEGHYFAALFVPPGGQGSAELRTVSLPPGEDGKPR